MIEAGDPFVQAVGRCGIGPSARKLGEPDALAVLIAGDRMTPDGEVVESMNDVRAAGPMRVALIVRGPTK